MVHVSLGWHYFVFWSFDYGLTLKLYAEFQVLGFILWHSCKWPLFPKFWITAFTALVVPFAFSRNAAVGTGLLIYIEQITVHFCGGSDSTHPQLWGL